MSVDGDIGWPEEQVYKSGSRSNHLESYNKFLICIQFVSISGSLLHVLMNSAKLSQTNWHHESGKLYLCEELITRYNHNLACPQYCKALTANLPIPEQPIHTFIRNQGGRAPPGTTRRIWSCRCAKSPQRTISCKNLGVSEILALCFTQLTVNQFDKAVQEVKTRYDINGPDHKSLRSFIIKHQ